MDKKNNRRVIYRSTSQIKKMTLGGDDLVLMPVKDGWDYKFYVVDPTTLQPVKNIMEVRDNRPRVYINREVRDRVRQLYGSTITRIVYLVPEFDGVIDRKFNDAWGESHYTELSKPYRDQLQNAIERPIRSKLSTLFAVHNLNVMRLFSKSSQDLGYKIYSLYEKKNNNNTDDWYNVYCSGGFQIKDIKQAIDKFAKLINLLWDNNLIYGVHYEPRFFRHDDPLTKISSYRLSIMTMMKNGTYNHEIYHKYKRYFDYRDEGDLMEIEL